MGGPHLESDTRFVAAIPVRHEKSNHQINTHLAISIHDPVMACVRKR
jgi:hypothetical protein